MATMTQTANLELLAPFEIKALSGMKRLIEGYASTFGTVDLGNDVVVQGAFSQSIKTKGPGGIQVFVNHDTGPLPVGALVQLREDDRGLFCSTKIFEGPAGDNLLGVAKGLMSLGRRLSMSIGFRIPPGGSSFDYVGAKRIRKIHEADLLEVSYTTTPMNTEAQVVDVKATMAEQQDERLRAFFKQEDLQQETELKVLFNPRGVLDDAARQIDAALADQKRREDLAIDVTLVRMDQALRLGYVKA